MKKFFVYVLIGAALYQAREAWRHRPLSQPDGVLVEQVPQQQLLPKDTKPILYKGEVLQPLAEYQIRGRLILQESYSRDRASQLSDLDLCIGWGPLSDSQILKKLRFNQTQRFCFYAWDNPAPLDPEIIKKSVSNIHIIPENELVRDVLKDLRPGQILNLSGYLVRVDYRNGGEWKSSLSRDDTGNGACEIMLVKSLNIE